MKIRPHSFKYFILEILNFVYFVYFFLDKNSND